MAIYISGVKGLPEQVQENKENIKTIQEEIEGIDFEEIRELEEQVAENTGDINSLEGTIGTQNIAITNLGDRTDTLEGKVATLENKTQEITYDDVNDTTNMQDVKAQDIEAHTLSITADNYGITNNEMQSKDGKGIIVLATDSNPTTSLINKASGTTHTLDFNDDGTLEIDGNPVGKSYYLHNVKFYRNATGGNHTRLDINVPVITSDPTPFTRDTFNDYLTAKGCNSVQTALGCMGSARNDINPNLGIITNIYKVAIYSDPTCTIVYDASQYTSDWSIISADFYGDNVIEL